MLSLEEEPEGELSNNGAILTISAAAVCVLLLVLGLLGLYYRSRVQRNTEQDFIKMEYRRRHQEHSDVDKVCVIDTLSFCDDLPRNSGHLQR